MEEIDKYNQMLKDLKNNFSQFEEVDNRVVEKKLDWCIGDIIICINNNFIKDEISHGPKEGLSLGFFYKISNILEEDMIIIENDNFETVSYFTWRFIKLLDNLIIIN